MDSDSDSKQNKNKMHRIWQWIDFQTDSESTAGLAGVLWVANFWKVGDQLLCNGTGIGIGFGIGFGFGIGIRIRIGFGIRIVFGIRQS